MSMSRNWNFYAICIALLVFPLISLACAKPTIRFSDEQYESLEVTNAIAMFVVENGYGYRTEKVVTTAEEMQELIENGDIDIQMEAWHHNHLPWYNPAIEAGKIVNLGLTYESGPQFFVVPKRFADEHNIRTITDMKEHWELLKDPNDSTRGVFLTCPRESGCGRVNSVKLEAYGLNQLYNLTVPQNFDDLEVRLENAQIARQPIFSYYWEPASLNEAYDWLVLEEPVYEEECWDKISRASFDEIPRPIDAACEYPRFAIDKIANADFVKKAPELADMFRRMNIGLEPLTEVINWAKENGITDPEQIAIRYLENNTDQYRNWMPDENYINVQKKVRGLRNY